MLHLSDIGLRILPASLYELEGSFWLHFGPLYQLKVPENLSVGERDQLASQIVMTHIAEQLPIDLRGVFH